MFRRHLVYRLAIFLLGSLAFPYVSQIFPPLDDIDLMLIFFGVIFFTTLFLSVTLERQARNRKDIEILKRIYAGFIPLPWILAATLFVNGRLDNSKNITYYPTVVEGRFNMKGIVRGSRRLLVRSWRPGQHFERLAVDQDDFDRFKDGDVRRSRRGTRRAWLSVVLRNVPTLKKSTIKITPQENRSDRMSQAPNLTRTNM